MNSRGLIAILAGTVFMFLAGWLVFGILLMDYYTANTTHYEGLMKEMPNLALIVVSNLSWALLLVVIYEKWAKIRSFGRGFLSGLFIGFLIVLSIDLWFVGGMNLFSVNSIIVDILVNTLLIGLMGGIIGWVLGYKRPSE